MSTARLKQCGDVYLAERGAIFDGNLRVPGHLGVRRPELFKYIIGSRFVTAIAINLVISFTIPGIDAWAHIGGLLGGFAIAWALGTPADDMYGGPAWWKGAIVFGTLGLMLAYILA